MSDIRSNFKQDRLFLNIYFYNSLAMKLDKNVPIQSLLITKIINNLWYKDICDNSKSFPKTSNIHTVSIKLQLIYVISMIAVELTII